LKLKRGGLRRHGDFVKLLLILDTILSPGNRLKAGRWNLTSADGASSVSTVFDSLQSSFDVLQSVRYNAACFESLRCALIRRGIIGGICDIDVAGIASFTFESGEIDPALELLLQKFLFEILEVHLSDTLPFIVA